MQDIVMTNQNFNDMNWHDCILYSIQLPNQNAELSLRLDYIYEWLLNKDTGFFDFIVAPVQLTFYGVYELRIDLNFSDHNDIYIQEITRTIASKGSWHFNINTDRGAISFFSFDFKQTELQPRHKSDGIEY